MLFNHSICKTLIILLLLPFIHLLADKPCWLDLPKDPLERIGNLYDINVAEVNELIFEYHTVPKTDGSRIPERIEILKEIERKLLIQTEKESYDFGKKSLQNVCQAAKEKRLYLENLEELKVKLANQKDYINDYFYKVPENYNSWQPLFLANLRKYDCRLRTYWGEYILEILDPCHRFLTSYFDLWRETNPGSTDYFSFFAWLEGQNVHFEITSVQFLTEEEKAKHEIVCKEGKIYAKNTGELFSCDQPGEYLFIIDLDERIYVIIGSKTIRHDSLSHGKPLLAAGNLVIVDGTITRLGLDSGHYQPTISNGVQLIEIFTENGINFSSNTIMEYFENSEKCSLSVEEFYCRYSDL